MPFPRDTTGHAADAHPAVVLRSRFPHLRALLTVAAVALVGPAAAVVIVATHDEVDAGTSTVPTPPSSAPHHGDLGILGPRPNVPYDGDPGILGPRPNVPYHGDPGIFGPRPSPRPNAERGILPVRPAARAGRVRMSSP
jgi:hypothetical protein